MSLANLVRVVTATTGTGTVTLGAAIQGFLTPSQAGMVDGSTYSYGIEANYVTVGDDLVPADREVGTGVYTASGTTLTRVVANSTNGNAALSLAGDAQVVITPIQSTFQGSARSVQGVAGNATADNASIQGTANQVLRVNAAGTALAFASSAALTKTDDTNVTLTLGGTPTTALLDATSLTLGWTGTLSVGRGGSGAGTFTANGVLYGNTTGALQVTAQGAANTVLTANAGAPSFSASPTIGTSVTTPLIIGGTAASSTLTLESTSGAGTTDTILFKTGSQAERMRIDTSGNVNIGFNGASPTTLFGGNLNLEINLAAAIHRYSNNTSGAYLAMVKSRATSSGGVTTVANGDALGIFTAAGTDGTGIIEAGNIGIETDGTVATNTMPGRIIFRTSVTTTPVEHLRVDSAGNVVVGGQARPTGYNISATNTFQVNAGNFLPLGFHSYGGASATSGAQMYLCFSRNSTVGTHTIVASGDRLGFIAGFGSDGATFTEAARIEFQAEGTPATSDVPGRILFNTAPQGSGSVERGRMDFKGNFIWGTGALGTTATGGFLYIPTCAGAPTGVPTAYTGRVPMIYDTTNNNFYIYNSGWKKTTVFS